MGNRETVCVSVIMPCHNDGRYLEEAVESLKKQTYSNLELLIIDDGSDEQESIDAVNNVSFPSLKVLHTDHVGPSGARNQGIREARGEYILPLDADDFIDPTYIEKAVNIMQENPDVGIVYCRADQFGERTGIWDLPDYSLKAELLDNVIFVTALFRKKDWEDIGGFCTTFKNGMEDYDFWLSLIQKGCEVVQIPEVLFHYRIKPVSRTTRFQDSYEGTQETYRILYERHKDLYRKNMDLFVPEIRRVLIDHIYQLRQFSLDPVVMYWAGARKLNPKRSEMFERWLRIKNRIKRLIGRK